MTNPYDAMGFFLGGVYYCAKEINILMPTGEVKRLTEQRETTSRLIHHGDLSKEMCPQFCSLPSYSAFQLMSLLLSLSLTTITHSGVMERTDVLHLEGLSLKSESNQQQKGAHDNKMQTFTQYFIFRLAALEMRK